ncbi:MarR family winged helix-turn-helix transcriptional regulator [Rathayibacter tanaceti]|nr:MarR family transcriptional regulator [Rathayibacter tanaceti]
MVADQRADARAADRVVWALRRAELAVQAEKERGLRPLGLAAAHYTFLATLAADAGLTGAELARRIGVTPQAVASLLTRLEARGLVERRSHPRHSHVHELHLTAPGHAALAEADRAIDAVEQKVVRLLGADGAEQLRGGLETLAAGIGADRPEPAAD